MQSLRTPTGLVKIAAELERRDGLSKTARTLPPGIPLARAATYGGLAGLGLHAGRKMLSAVAGAPDPTERGESALGSAASTALGGAAIAGLLNLLNRVTARRR